VTPVSSPAGLADLDALTSLEDPVRRRLYQLVARSRRPVGRDEAAAGASIGRPLAAYHLDKLVESGLLEATYARPEGRGGPGAGRPAKLYRRALREFDFRAPPRDYRLLGELLVRSAAADPAVRASVERAAAELGESLAAGGGSLVQVLEERGYEPFVEAPGVLRLRNCPFGALAARPADVVCGLNLALVRGIVRGLGADPELAVLAPEEGNCCVALRLGPR